MNKLFTIAKNTFTETLRQPIYGIIIAAAILLFVLSPSITMYSMEDDDKLLREVGLSTLFLASLFISIFAASGAVGQEIENKTITTVLSKPVQRPIFILAKFFGVIGAVGLAHYLCTIVLLMAIRHGVLEAAWEKPDWTVIVTGGIVATASILISAFCNYAYDWKFSSTAVVFAAILATGAIIFLAMIDRNWQFNPKEDGINISDIHAAVLLFLAAMIITALAIALSSRFNIVVTLAGCIGLFLLGLVSDYVFGRFADGNIWAKIAYYVIPNLQIFWVSDAIYEESVVPLRYILTSSFYAIAYSAGILAISISLFQRREVG